MSSAHVRGARAPKLSAGLMVAYAGLFATNGLIAAVRGTSAGGDLAFSAAFVVAAVWSAYGLSRRATWAWWASVCLAGLGLFFVLPVAATILLGDALEPVGTGWDVVFFPLTALVLIGLLSALWAQWKTVDGPGRSSAGPS